VFQLQWFSTFSDDLYALADWLKSLNVEVMAMAATGVYWIPLYKVLDARGFPVNLVNSRATRDLWAAHRLATFGAAPTRHSGPRAMW